MPPARRIRGSAVVEPRSPARRLGSLNPCKRKRKRAASTCAAAPRNRPSAVEEPRDGDGPDWAWLHEDMLPLVAWSVLAGDNGILDYVRFRAVCRHWRSTTACPRGRGVVDARFHPRHWRMLPEGYGLYPGHTKLAGRLRFLNLRTGAFACVVIHRPCTPNIFRDHFIMDSVDGILLLQRDTDMAVRLLNPFTGDIVDLPSLAPLTPHFAPYAGVLVSSLSASHNGVITVMLAFATPLLPALDESRVAIATSKDHQWTLSNWKAKLGTSILPFQGKLYFFTPDIHLFMIAPFEGSSLLPPPKLIATCPRDKISPPDRFKAHLVLVECESEILLVGKDINSTSWLQFDLIYRLNDIIMGRFVPLKCIGGNCLTISRHRSLCVSSMVHPSIVGDSIVSIFPPGEDLEQYHIKSGTLSAAVDGNILVGPLPSPYSLMHHIYTCCVNSYWNKGRIYCQCQVESCKPFRWPKKRRRLLGA